MKTLETLLKEREELLAQLQEIEDTILIVEDGFFYICYTSEWGNHELRFFNNRIACKDFAKCYYGDNGFCHVFTNNYEMLDEVLDNLEIVDSFEELEKTWVYDEIKERNRGRRDWAARYQNYKRRKVFNKQNYENKN